MGGHMTTRFVATVAAAALISAFLGAAPAAAATAVANPGFESGPGTATPAGWSEAGTVSASYTEAGGRSGDLRLTHWSASAYQVETYQTLSGLRHGHYVLRAWVRSS